MTMLYFLMFSLCSGGFFCLMLAGVTLLAAALAAALASPHPAAASTSWFGCLSAGAALCTVAVYFRGKGARRK